MPARKAAESAPKKGGGLFVTAPLVQVRVGSQVLHLSAGDVIPDGIDGDSLEHLKSLGYVGESDAPESDDN